MGNAAVTPTDESAATPEAEGSAHAIVGQFIAACEESLICLVFATRGLEAMHDEALVKDANPNQRIWIGSNMEADPRYHASILTSSFLEKSKRDGAFTSDMAKAFLCTLYALWDESCRPALAQLGGYEPSDVKAPLMGDLRKIRHCILHNKSKIPKSGLAFEVLAWPDMAGELVVTRDMFRDVIDAIRTQLEIKAVVLSPEARRLRDRMTRKERERFDAWAKKLSVHTTESEWPGMKAVRARLERDEQKRTMTKKHT
jgi:hypothetical protein